MSPRSTLLAHCVLIAAALVATPGEAGVGAGGAPAQGVESVSVAKQSARRCPKGTAPLRTNLNAGVAGGATALYLCLKFTSDPAAMVQDLAAVRGADCRAAAAGAAAAGPWLLAADAKGLAYDLNEGVPGRPPNSVVVVCLAAHDPRQARVSYLANATVVAGAKGCPSGWARSPTNLNDRVGGSKLFICKQLVQAQGDNSAVASPSPAPPQRPSPSPSPPPPSAIPSPSPKPNCPKGVAFDGCGAFADGFCCPDGMCCSLGGYCGTSEDHCELARGCQAGYGLCTGTMPANCPRGFSASFRCGPDNGDFCCIEGLCCSASGYCGDSDGHCGTGCQAGYGRCDTAGGGPPPTPSPSPAPRPSPSPAPRPSPSPAPLPSPSPAPRPSPSPAPLPSPSPTPLPSPSPAPLPSPSPAPLPSPSPAPRPSPSPAPLPSPSPAPPQRPSPSPSPPPPSAIPSPSPKPNCPKGVAFDGCGAFADGFCCPDGMCCSLGGYCGTSEDHCELARGCQAGYGLCTGTMPANCPRGFSASFRCGPDNGDFCCIEGLCCSASGYCGDSDGHCGTSCQAGYGRCDTAGGGPPPTPSPSPAPRPSPSPAPRPSPSPAPLPSPSPAPRPSPSPAPLPSPSPTPLPSPSPAPLPSPSPAPLPSPSPAPRPSPSPAPLPSPSPAPPQRPSPSPSPPPPSAIPSPSPKPNCPKGVAFDGCGAFADGFCCPDGMCCSLGGYCGTSEDHCELARGCQAGYGLCTGTMPANCPRGFSASFRCGPDNGDFCCIEGLCCSASGYCGDSDGHCGTSCQAGYGRCDTAGGGPPPPQGPSPGCLGDPTPVANATWVGCNGTSNGTNCTAQCSDGSAAGPSGPPTAACVQGVWLDATGECIPESAFVAAACFTLPDQADHAEWDASCIGTPVEQACQASCYAGYAAAGAGSSGYSATCDQGLWGPVSGQCSPQSCSGPPPSVANADWEGCADADHGTNCTAECAPGFVPGPDGPPSAACSLGEWHTAAGECVEAACPSPPPALAAGEWLCTSGAPNDANCLGRCRDGFDGSPQASCSMGAWGSVDGACLPLPTATLTVGPWYTCATTPQGSVGCWGWIPQNTVSWRGAEYTLSVPAPREGERFVSVSVGNGYHSCGVTDGGRVLCWSPMKPGDPSTRLPTPNAVDVPPDLGPAAAVVATQDDVCAVTRAGQVRCWGATYSTEFGAAEVPPSQELGTIKRIAGSGACMCTVNDRQALRCWGPLYSCRFYDPTFTFVQPTVPSEIDNQPGSVTDVALNSRLLCVVAAAGARVRCWSKEFDQGGGFVGFAPLDVPSDVGPSRAVVVARDPGEHVCALAADSGRVRCFFGSNSRGQLNVPGDLGAASGLACGRFRSCAMVGSGERIRCWGESTPDDPGTVPDDWAAPPVPPPPCGQAPATATQFAAQPGAAVALAAGARFVCATLDTGRVSCFGADYWGETRPPADLDRVVSLAAGVGFACAVTEGGSGRCWGNIDWAGGGLAGRSLCPALSVAAGSSELCVTTAGGEGLYCHGDPRFPSPAAISSALGQASAAVSVSAWEGSYFVCGINATGAARCAGKYNAFGELNVPAGLGRVRAVAAGRGCACAATSGGDLRCWGAACPAVSNPGGVVGVAMGSAHVCVRTAVTVPGGLPGFGSGVAINLFGLRCFGAGPEAAVPPGLGYVSSVAAGDGFTCALLPSGRVACWPPERIQAPLGLAFTCQQLDPSLCPAGAVVTAATARCDPQPCTPAKCCVWPESAVSSGCADNQACLVKGLKRFKLPAVSLPSPHVMVTPTIVRDLGRTISEYGEAAAHAVEDAVKDAAKDIAKAVEEAAKVLAGIVFDVVCVPAMVAAHMANAAAVEALATVVQRYSVPSSVSFDGATIHPLSDWRPSYSAEEPLGSVLNYAEIVFVPLLPSNTAQTFGRTIYVNVAHWSSMDKIFDAAYNEQHHGSKTAGIELLLHELVHVEQHWRFAFKIEIFAAVYEAFWCDNVAKGYGALSKDGSAGEAYAKNKYEVEARERATTILLALCCTNRAGSTCKPQATCPTTPRPPTGGGGGGGGGCRVRCMPY